MFNADAECWHDLPGPFPKTRIWFRAYTQEDQSANGANSARIRKAELQVGRESDDPSVDRKVSAANRAAVATKILRVENLRAPDDSVTDKAEIEELLRTLPLSQYVRLTDDMAEGLGCFEGKA
jgi:hypothetical protein